MNRMILLLLVFILESFSLQDIPDVENWRLVRQGADVEVFQQPTPNGYAAIKVKSTIEVSMEKFINLINDVDRYNEWVYRCAGAKKIDDPDTDTLKYILVSDFPFPFKDRILAVESIQSADANGVFYSRSRAAPDLIGQSSNVIIRDFDSTWKVTPSKSRINIEYEVKTQPGGMIPSWLFNLAVDQGPFRTMTNLKEILESGS